MSVRKITPKKVTYLRAHDTDKNHIVLLGGDSRWIRDIELLLEDQWKNLYCPEDFSSFTRTLVEHPPRVCIAEFGAYNGNEIKLLDLNMPTGIEKILIGHDIKDPLLWRRTQRSVAARGVKCIELSEDSKTASEELSEVLTGICAAGFSVTNDLHLIQSAFQGYRIAGGAEDQTFLKLFKTMASKFVFEPEDIVTGTLFAETYSLWKKPKDASSPLQFAFSNAEASVRNENVFKLIDFSKKCVDAFNSTGNLDEETFQKLVADSDFGRLTSRLIKGALPEVTSCLTQASGGLKLVKVA
jgi:hypothetical protein